MARRREDGPPARMRAEESGENKLERTAGTAEGFVRRGLHGKPAGCFFARAVRVF